MVPALSDLTDGWESQLGKEVMAEYDSSHSSVVSQVRGGGRGLAGPQRRGLGRVEGFRKDMRCKGARGFTNE